MILLPLLAGKLTLPSYLAEILLDYILLFSLHSQRLTMIERRLKMGKEERKKEKWRKKSE